MPIIAESENILNFEKNVNHYRQKVDGPKKKMGTLSCSVKNRTECPYLLKEKIFWTLKNVNHFKPKIEEPKKKLDILSCSVKNRIECPYLLKDKKFETLKKMSIILRKNLTNQKKSWASYPAHLRTE